MAVQNFNTPVALKQVDETTIDQNIKVLVKDEITGEVQEVPKDSFVGDTPTLQEVLNAGSTSNVPYIFEIQVDSNKSTLLLNPDYVSIHSVTPDSTVKGAFEITNGSPSISVSNQNGAFSSSLSFNTTGEGFYFETGNTKKGLQYYEAPNALTSLSLVHKQYVDNYLTSITGYNASATQTLKNISGVLQWVTD